MNKATVYIVDDDDELREALGEGVELAIGCSVKTFSNAEGALKTLRSDMYGVVVSDLRLPNTDGLSLLAAVMELDPALPVIVITGHGDVPLAVDAMRRGAYDFIEKPFGTDQLVSSIGRALERRQLVLENRVLREQLENRTGLETRLVGRSIPMERLRAEVLAIAATDADVLITGETGAGKEVVSRSIHQESKRKNGPFVALNCGALPADMIESELFGHEKGAFTGAVRQRVGRLEDARGGTVLLDEIESMPLALQVKLLRVIENRSIERLGSNRSIDLDVRFLAATKVDLAMASKAGTFREDLYYRLNVISVGIPPLRERLDDIPGLFHALARDARARYGREIPELPPKLMNSFMAYSWPGNVRELRNVADRWVLNVPIGPVFEKGTAAVLPATESNSNLLEKTAVYERGVIVRTIQDAKGNITSAAQALGVSRKTLYDKMRRLDINPRSI